MSPILLESMIDANTALAIEPEELAGVLWMHLNSLPDRDSALNRHNFFQDPRHTFAGFPPDKREAVADAFLAAWTWLEREGLLLPRVGAGHPDWVFVSRRGRAMQRRADVDTYRRAHMLSPKLLHPAIAERVTANFLRGDYDMAVLQAFKEVEVAVRTAGKFAAEDVGVPLMRKAFIERSVRYATQPCRKPNVRRRRTCSRAQSVPSRMRRVTGPSILRIRLRRSKSSCSQVICSGSWTSAPRRRSGHRRHEASYRFVDIGRSSIARRS